MRPQILLSILLVGLFAIITNSPAVYSQFLPCNIVSIAPTGPPTVGAGQTLQVTTAVTGSCDQSMFYAVRVDLADGRSSKVLSSVVFPYAPVTAVFTVSITNTATAPTTLGTWVLQVNAYLIASLNGAVVASSHVLFSVGVVPYTPPTTTTEQMATTYSTTTISMAPISSSSQMSSISESALAVSTSSSAVPQNSNQTGNTFAALAAIVVVLAIITIAMLLRRKRTTQRSQPQASAGVKYCEHCGTKLMIADEFCSNCGSRQN